MLNSLVIVGHVVGGTVGVGAGGDLAGGVGVVEVDTGGDDRDRGVVLGEHRKDGVLWPSGED